MGATDSLIQRSQNNFLSAPTEQRNEIPQATNRVVGILGLGRCAADRVVGAELLLLGHGHPYESVSRFDD
jgi:hypothetical protein